ncbi:MAG: hypothetical protein OXG79_00475 [Chloroflexi bacterium]|nr:hypothetical protein [Chloroflexota bacterium]MCY4111321.1 hypothetical protein [Chloroflexota bacterium]
MPRAGTSERPFRQKTAKLKAFAGHVHDAHDGDLDHMLRAPMEPLRRELLGIWGVGPETADAILLHAARNPSFVVDAYTQRALERLGVIPGSVLRAALRALLLEALPRDPWQLAEAHGLFVRLGKAHCGSTPDCATCPLLLGRQYGSGGSVR